ncbi:hypothetical protein HG536_0D05690 [Torulaspora globosa]|uniref:GATA-type domain-containing protein n=1 Tax=Torulaspora globosa TaxID=48254 RepID=A0A7G3ZHR2_9SACH|nr:uncharacterized protein HG536_0D05690 [Torulaspora globosa]QLL33048.1 hypothetical protein HG536_0D05690 [Torulaspora globosa]
MPMAGGSNLYDIFDQPSHGRLTNDQHAAGGDGEMNLGSGISLSAASAFDTMLEMLPDNTDFSFFGNTNGCDTPKNESRSNSRKGSMFRDTVNGSGQMPSQMQNEFDSVLDRISTKDIIVEGGANQMTQAIEIANQQNGEITQLWDFNVDDFMMTPEGSGSATISAPNSFISEGQLHSTGAPGVPLMSVSSNYQNGPLDPMSVGNNFSQFLSTGIPFPNQGAATLFNRSASSSPKYNGSQITLKKEESTNFHRPPLGGRRSSMQLSKSVHTEDGGIYISTANGASSVRKNSLGRQISSTSLSSYKRGSSSAVPEIQRKPSLSCFNCKTQKTPLWRRDSQGNTLCNACGLFQKLHGTMRPLSLKTDVIKKRNNRKRAKKQQEQAEKANGSSDSKSSQNTSDKKAVSGTTSNAPTPPKNPRSRKKSSQPSNMNTLTNDSTLSLAESQNSMSANDGKYDLGMSYNAPIGTYSPNNLESLNPNNLITHNKKIANMNSSTSRKPRRDSTSSNNSCSSKSSSRSVVPILPKPSTNTGNPSSFSMGFSTSTSAGNSAASSPRVVGPSLNPSSPMTPSQNAFSTSTSRQGISIPRQKLSRNHSSSSSSFMAASLQQLQQQNQQNQQNYQPQQLQTSNDSIAQSNNWNLASAGASPAVARSPKTGFDLFNSPSNSPGVPSGKKSQTSLLSQQLQNSSSSQANHKPESTTNEITTNGQHQHQNSMTNSPQPLSLRRSSVAASPRNSYADSVMQHRGLYDSNLTLRRQSSLGLRRNAHSRDQVLSPNAELIGVGSTHTSTVSTPTTSATVTSVTATTGNDRSSSALNSAISDELDWLKFGM